MHWKVVTPASPINLPPGEYYFGAEGRDYSHSIGRRFGETGQTCRIKTTSFDIGGPPNPFGSVTITEANVSTCIYADYRPNALLFETLGLDPQIKTDPTQLWLLEDLEIRGFIASPYWIYEELNLLDEILDVHIIPVTYSTGFETGNLIRADGKSSWQGTVTVSSNQAHHDSFSVMTEVNNPAINDGYAFFYKNISGTEIYIRVFVYFETLKDRVRVVDQGVQNDVKNHQDSQQKACCHQNSRGIPFYLKR